MPYDLFTIWLCLLIGYNLGRTIAYTRITTPAFLLSCILIKIATMS